MSLTGVSDMILDRYFPFWYNPRGTTWVCFQIAFSSDQWHSQRGANAVSTTVTAMCYVSQPLLLIAEPFQAAMVKRGGSRFQPSGNGILVACCSTGSTYDASSTLATMLLLLICCQLSLFSWLCSLLFLAAYNIFLKLHSFCESCSYLTFMIQLCLLLPKL